MRLVLSGLTVVVATCLLAPVGSAFAPKPADYTTASVEFRDQTGDGIMSDGNRIYADGTSRGLEVRMWINGSQDLTIGTFASGRKIRFTYTPASVINGPAPAGELLDNAFVNIRAIASIPVGQTQITKASFNTAIGYFRWLGSPYPAAGSVSGDPYGSQAVRVHRSSQMTWEVDAPIDPVPFYDPESQTDYVASDLSVLLKDGRRGTLTPVALYHMPFGLTVTCPDCP